MDEANEKTQIEKGAEPRANRSHKADARSARQKPRHASREEEKEIEAVAQNSQLSKRAIEAFCATCSDPGAARATIYTARTKRLHEATSPRRSFPQGIQR